MQNEIFHERLHYPPEQSFIIKYNDIQHFTFPFHYHQEYEIVFVKKSRGQRFVGDQIEKFQDGDLTLLGSMLPHCFINEKAYYENDPNLRVNAYIIQFPSDFFSERMLNSPEFYKISQLLGASERGVLFLNLDIDMIDIAFQQIMNAKGCEKYIRFIQLLDDLSQKEIKILASKGYMHDCPWNKNSRLSKVYQYVMKHYREDIELKKAAEIAVMSPSAFCRYFKEKTRQTFKEFLIDLRISYACKLLQIAEMSISQICFESGFCNVSNFNRQFLKSQGESPTKYREKYQ